MSDVLIRLKGVPAEVLEQLVRQGFFSTKSEAIRAGLLQLGKEFKLLDASHPIQGRMRSNASNDVVVEMLDRWM